MCFAVKFTAKGQQQTVYTSKDSTIPVVQSNGDTQMVRWGRDKKEPGQSFAHHCARIESINAGKWSWLKPKAVNLDIEEFADWGSDNQVHWHVVPEQHSLRGALVQDGNILRVYIVTEPVIESMKQYSKGDRWPRIVSDVVRT